MAINSIKNLQSVGQRQRVKIFTVEPSTRTVHATLMREGAGIVVAVWETAVAFRWPVEGEIWTVYKGTNGIWMLDKPVETVDTPYSVENLNPGDAKIDSDVIKTASGQDVVITDQAAAGTGQSLAWNGANWATADFLSTVGGAVGVNLDMGSDTITWPGASTASTPLTISHNLGVVPQGYQAFATSQAGTGAVLVNGREDLAIADEVSFQLSATTLGTQPAITITTPITWIAWA